MKPENINKEIAWSHLKWLDELNYLNENDLPTDALMVKVYRDTIKAVDNKQYLVGKEITSLEEIISTKYYDSVDNICRRDNVSENSFSVIKENVLDVAGLLKKSGLNPVVLNVGNPRSPGGDVVSGFKGVEEDIFIRTNIFLSLYRFSNIRQLYKLESGKSKYMYPLLNDEHCIYSKDVSVFRGDMETGYMYMKRPFCVSFITIPYIVRPNLDFFEGKYLIAKEYLEKIKKRIKTALRVAFHEGHDSIVISGFGNTSLKYPPEHIATVFADFFEEVEFSGSFKSIVFAIIDNPKIREEYNVDGDFIPFYNKFM